MGTNVLTGKKRIRYCQRPSNLYVRVRFRSRGVKVAAQKGGRATLGSRTRACQLAALH